jgi:CHAT domain-containing protein
MLDEARFNHALLLEQLQLRIQAEDAWRRYRERDDNSPWAKEADQRITALSRRDSLPSRGDWRKAGVDSTTLTRLTSEDRAGGRDFAQRELGAWAASVRGGDTASARRHLAAARIIANAFREQTGDAFLHDGIAAIDRAIADNDAGRVNALVDGHEALDAALDSFPRQMPTREALLVARKQLGRAASPMASLAVLTHARLRANFRGDSSLVWLRSIRDSAPASYISLRATAAQYTGYVNDLRPDYVRAIANYDSALAENRAIRDPQTAIRTASWLAQCEEILRGREAAWRTRYSALIASRDAKTPLAVFTAFDYAMQATMNDAPRLALRYALEAIRNAREMKDSTTIAYAFRDRATIHVRLGQDSLARAAIDSSHAIAPAEKTKLRADIDLAGANVTMHSEPAKAEAELRQVIDEYVHGETDDGRGLSLAYLYIAKARAAAGMIESAKAAFDTATMLMQRQRASLKDVADRGAFLDAARSVFDEILAFHVDHNDRDAFEFFESTRSRVLLDQLSTDAAVSSPRPVLRDLQARLAKDDLVLSYAVLPGRLVVWLVGRDRFEQRRIAIQASDLENLVTKFRESVRTATGEPDSVLGGELYRILVDSANTLDAKNLIVIPDRWLHFVPFAALRNPATRRLLLLDRTVSYEPSATLLVASLSKTPRRFSRDSKILAIGNPAFDTSAFRLRYLPAAEAEARRVARLYNDQSALLRNDATDVALERLAPEAEIIHFAGHAVVGRDAPQLSHLVLASDGQSDGVVFSTEIARWRLDRTRLVILSACNTADGKLSATEGASSLARAFFVAGVPSVVASLWAIDDDDIAEFFYSFHARLAAGQSAAAALQEAQIRALNAGGRRHPARSWAAFQLFGHP